MALTNKKKNCIISKHDNVIIEAGISLKLCNFFINGHIHAGVLINGGVYDLTAAGYSGSLTDIIYDGELPAPPDENATLLDVDDLMFANITEPRKIICIGLNYKKHAEETGGEPPAEPVIFSKFNDTLSPAGGGIRLPPELRCFDYEAELVIIIGKWADRVSVDEADNYVFGYACGNDLSARDAQFRSSQWLLGKTPEGFAPVGPFVTTADEFDPYADNAITCSVNGKIVQNDLTSGMIFGCRELVSYISRFTRLAPGDLIFTGTPCGVILGQPKGHRVWLKKGDVVSVQIGGLGTLTNTLL